MKRLIGVIAMVGFTLIGMQAASAGTLETGKNDRRGFFIGFGVGGGGIQFVAPSVKRFRGAFLGDFKIGGAVNEKVLLMYDGSVAYTRIEGVDFDVTNSAFGVQWFVWDNLYVRPAVGFAVATASVNSNGTTTSKDSKVSVGADFAAGYEFRFGKYFAVGPELVYRYAHIRSDITNAHSHAFGGQASFLWYF